MKYQKHLNCEYIEDGRKKYEKVYFVNDSISGISGEAYRLNGIVASGGNSSVFICYRSGSNQQQAVKFLRILTENRRNRFDFEELVLQGLEHPGILPVCDVGLVETTFKKMDVPFIVTDFYTTNVERRLRDEGKFSISEIKNFGLQICDAFSYLHSRGIIHRDIKPSNFLIKDNKAIVADFGLAKTVNDEGIDRFWRGDMTESNERVGSAPWMSPELLRYAADKTQKVDARSDIFQIGRVLWYMHTESITGLPDADDDQSGGILHEIVCKAFQSKPEKRFQSIQEMAELLDTL